MIKSGRISYAVDNIAENLKKKLCEHITELTDGDFQKAASRHLTYGGSQHGNSPAKAQ